VGPKFWAADVKRPDPVFPKIDDYLIDGFFPEGTPITMPLGIEPEGKLKLVELSDPNTAHWIIAGQTGGGKSEAQLTMLRWWMQWRPEEIQVIVVDAKQVTFTNFEGVERIKNIADFAKIGIDQAELLFPDLVKADQFCSKFQAWLPRGVILTPREAVEVFGDVKDRVQERKALFRRVGAKNLKEFNARMRQLGLPILPHLVVMIDEYYVLTSDKKDKDAIEAHLKVCLAEARAFGVTFFFATQRPSVEVFSMLIRSNCGGRMGLLMDGNSSRITLDKIEDGEDGGICANLLGKGDAWVKCGSELTRVQMPYWDGKNLPADPSPTIKPTVQVEKRAVERPVAPAIPVDQEVATEGMSVPPVPHEGEVDAMTMLERSYAMAAVERPNSEIVIESEGGATEPGKRGRPTKFEQTKRLYLEYRGWRESGKAPYKFVEAKFGRGSAENRCRLEEEISEWIKDWIFELAEKGESPAQIVKLIWNYGTTKAKPKGDEKFQGAMEVVKKVLGG
jgi:hypothetical protein